MELRLEILTRLPFTLGGCNFWNNRIKWEPQNGPADLSMALPAMISMIINALYNIVDSFFVAKISEDAMTALSLVYPAQNLLTAVAVGFGVGVNAMISFYLGAQNQEKADKTATQGMVLGVLHGVLLMVLFLCGMNLFLGMFTKSDTVRALGMEYSNVVFLFSAIVTGASHWRKYSRR